MPKSNQSTVDLSKLTAVTAVGDGNCAFNAFALALCDNADYFKQIKTADLPNKAPGLQMLLDGWNQYYASKDEQLTDHVQLIDKLLEIEQADPRRMQIMLAPLLRIFSVNDIEQREKIQDQCNIALTNAMLHVLEVLETKPHNSFISSLTSSKSDVGIAALKEALEFDKADAKIRENEDAKRFFTLVFRVYEWLGQDKYRHKLELLEFREKIYQATKDAIKANNTKQLFECIESGKALKHLGTDMDGDPIDKKLQVTITKMLYYAQGLDVSQDDWQKNNKKVGESIKQTSLKLQDAQGIIKKVCDAEDEFENALESTLSDANLEAAVKQCLSHSEIVWTLGDRIQIMNAISGIEAKTTAGIVDSLKKKWKNDWESHQDEYYDALIKVKGIDVKSVSDFKALSTKQKIIWLKLAQEKSVPALWNTGAKTFFDSKLNDVTAAALDGTFSLPEIENSIKTHLSQLETNIEGNLSEDLLHYLRIAAGGKQKSTKGSDQMAEYLKLMKDNFKRVYKTRVIHEKWEAYYEKSRDEVRAKTDILETLFAQNFLESIKDDPELLQAAKLAQDKCLDLIRIQYVSDKQKAENSKVSASIEREAGLEAEDAFKYFYDTKAHASIRTKEFRESVRQFAISHIKESQIRKDKRYYDLMENGFNLKSPSKIAEAQSTFRKWWVEKGLKIYCDALRAPATRVLETKNFSSGAANSDQYGGDHELSRLAELLGVGIDIGQVTSAKGSVDKVFRRGIDKPITFTLRYQGRNHYDAFLTKPVVSKSERNSSFATASPKAAGSNATKQFDFSAFDDLQEENNGIKALASLLGTGVMIGAGVLILAFASIQLVPMAAVLITLGLMASAAFVFYATKYLFDGYRLSDELFSPDLLEPTPTPTPTPATATDGPKARQSPVQQTLTDDATASPVSTQRLRRRRVPAVAANDAEATTSSTQAVASQERSQESSPLLSQSPHALHSVPKRSSATKDEGETARKDNHVTGMCVVQ